MTANKHSGIRSALCWKKEIAVLARQHNNANILALPARFLTNEEGIEIPQRAHQRQRRQILLRIH